MVDVSDRVKEELVKDNKKISFVVHFPNGERADLTEDEVEDNSVNFEESICSKRYLKFGLTEANRINFQTVGVENIIGREIECAYNVYSHEMVGKDIYASRNTGWYPARPDNIKYMDCNTLYYDPSQTGDYQRIADVRDCYIYYSKPMSYSGEGMIPGYDNTLYAGDICKYHREYGEFEKINPSEKLIEAIKSVQGGDAVYMRFKTPDGAYYGQVGWWFNRDIDGEETDIIYFGDEVMPYITYENVYTKEGSVPLGRFTVKSCPRNHENMTRRKVTAYSLQQPQLSDIMQFQLNTMRLYESNTFKILIQDFLAANMNMDGFEDLYTEISAPTADNWDNRYEIGEDSTYVYYIGTISNALKSMFINFPSSGYSLSSLFKITLNKGADYDEFKKYIGQLSEDLGSSLTSSIEKFLGCCLTGGNPRVSYVLDPKSYTFLSFGSSFECVFTNGNNKVQIFRRKKYKLPVQYEVLKEFDVISSVEVKRYTSDSTLTMTLQSTGKEGDYYTFTDSVDFTKLFNGWLELNALFGAQQRDGSYALKHLSKDNPIEIGKDLIGRLWWDEYDVKPIGSVKYSFKSGSEQQIAVYQFGSGKSEYDMTGNYVLLNMDNASMSNINTLLDQLFIPNIEDIGFTPVDLTMKGLPYIEAGDFLRIIIKDDTTELTGSIGYSTGGRLNYTQIVVTDEVIPDFDTTKVIEIEVNDVIVDGYTVSYARMTPTSGYVKVYFDDDYTMGDIVTLLYGEREVVETYVMQRSLSGIQSLTDDIESSGGEIIESEVIEDES